MLQVCVHVCNPTDPRIMMESKVAYSMLETAPWAVALCNVCHRFAGLTHIALGALRATGADASCLSNHS